MQIFWFLLEKLIHKIILFLCCKTRLQHRWRADPSGVKACAVALPNSLVTPDPKTENRGEISATCHLLSWNLAHALHQVLLFLQRATGPYQGAGPRSHTELGVSHCPEGRTPPTESPSVLPAAPHSSRCISRQRLTQPRPAELLWLQTPHMRSGADFQIVCWKHWGQRTCCFVVRPPLRRICLMSLKPSAVSSYHAVMSENELQGLNVVSGPTTLSQLAERRRDGSWFLLWRPARLQAPSASFSSCLGKNSWHLGLGLYGLCRCCTPCSGRQNGGGGSLW